jgi:hypothetical protein
MSMNIAFVIRKLKAKTKLMKLGTTYLTYK